MYEHQGLTEIFYMMLHGGVAVLALVSSLYLWFSRSNIFQHSVTPPRLLRKSAAIFLAAVFASHLWWTLLGHVWLTDNMELRNLICELLDFTTFTASIIAVMLCMLQDRRRPIWPWHALVMIFSVVTVVCYVAGGPWERFVSVSYYVLIPVFVIYFVRAMVQYGHWLRRNYADMENKELWQSMLLFAVIMLMFTTYASNEGGMVSEYLTQVSSFALIGFILWRVETLQSLYGAAGADDADEDMMADDADNFVWTGDIKPPFNFAAALKENCEDAGLYLQYDLTLVELASVLNTNRTYLGVWFASQGTNYSSYINRLRIEHFCKLYHTAGEKTTVKDLARNCGYRSYSTFNANFKRIMGETVTQWMEKTGR